MKCLVPDCSAVLTEQESFCPAHLEAYLDFLKLTDDYERGSQRAIIQSNSGRLNLAKKMGVIDVPASTPSASVVALELQPTNSNSPAPNDDNPGESLVCSQCQVDRGEQRFICSECTSKIIERARMAYGISPTDIQQIESMRNKLAEEGSAKKLLASINDDTLQPATATPPAGATVQSPKPNEAPNAISKVVTPIVVIAGILGISMPFAMTMMTGGSGRDLGRIAVETVQGKVEGSSNVATAPANSGIEKVPVEKIRKFALSQTLFPVSELFRKGERRYFESEVFIKGYGNVKITMDQLYVTYSVPEDGPIEGLAYVMGRMHGKEAGEDVKNGKVHLAYDSDGKVVKYVIGKNGWGFFASTFRNVAYWTIVDAKKADSMYRQALQKNGAP